MKVLRHVSITVLISSAIVSCSNQRPVSQQPSPQKKIESTKAGDVSAQQYVAMAKNSSPVAAISLLIKASNQFVKEQNFTQALWLAEQTYPLTNITTEQKQLSLIIVESLINLQQPELALDTITQIDIDNDISVEQLHTYYQFLATIQHKRGLDLVAVDANLRAFAIQKDEAQIANLWQQLNGLAQWQIEQLAQLKPPYIKGWQQLLNFSHRFGYEPQTFQRYLTQWQRQYPQHPARILIPELANTTFDNTHDLNNIAIILPLSGKQKGAGEAAQQGILASFNNSDDKKLFFIDANTLDFSTLSEQLAQLNADYVIGPLLKSNVDSYLGQSNIDTPTLLLNMPIHQQIKPQHIVFSMDPSDEAVQAATTLSRQHYIHPIVFSQNDKVSERIATTFAKQWQTITGEKPEVIVFNRDGKILTQLKESLEVEYSQQRIDNIDKRIRRKLKTQTRNRRDIDMIYLVGSPNETRLLKPYIDVNISPFANAIPIFASSRSHSDNADRSDSRDLTGLKFTEMPWLLNSKQQNKSLKALNKAIWPDRNDSLQRIFAMGYDSLALLNKFNALKQTPYIRHFGQTGVLKLNDKGILTRSLLWGSYQKDKAEEIAMD